jgi:hypothetical protein
MDRIDRKCASLGERSGDVMITTAPFFFFSIKLAELPRCPV